MKQTPFGSYLVPEYTKLHHESARVLFMAAVKVFKSIGENSGIEMFKVLLGQKNMYQGTLNLEHGVAICLYMLLKEMSFDDVKEIFSESKNVENIALMKKLLSQNDGAAEIPLDEKSETDTATLLEQMLFFMFWEICGYANSESKDKKHPFENWLGNPHVFNDSGINFSSCFHPFMDIQNLEIKMAIQQLKCSPKQAVEYRNPFWWKNPELRLNWFAFKTHFNGSNEKDVFDENFLNVSELRDRSLIVELLFRFSRTEPEFKENIIAMLNHLREVQKEFFPIYYDSKAKCYNQDALKNQEKVKSIDSGFRIPVIYQSLFPFNTDAVIKKYGEERQFCRFVVECKLFQESGVVLQSDDKNRISQNYRESNKVAMYTRYLYLDRNNYVHYGTSRAIKELLKPTKCRDLLFMLSDILLYFDSDSNRYADNESKKNWVSNIFFSKNEICSESIKTECKTLASLILKINGRESDEITRTIIEDFAASLPYSAKIDYDCELSKTEFLRERLERLLNIMFLTYEPDFCSHSIDFLLEHKMSVLLYIASVTFKLLKELEKIEK